CELASQSVGFHVSLSTTTAFGDHQIVVFDTIVTNVGNGYDSRHGHFTAPASGLYAFAITILCHASESPVHAAIIRDCEMVGNAHSNVDNYDSGSTTPSWAYATNDGTANYNIVFYANMFPDVALGDHQIVVFVTIVTNDGNGYGPYQGHFTAPVTGLYAFSVTVT
ncbi:uncharacterized protein, partial [Argopecten irradians]